LYFKKLNKPVLPLILPMIFIMCITIISLVLKTVDFIASGNNLLTALNTLLIVLIFWMITEGFLLLKNRRLNG